MFWEASECWFRESYVSLENEVLYNVYLMLWRGKRQRNRNVINWIHPDHQTGFILIHLSLISEDCNLTVTLTVAVDSQLTVKLFWICLLVSGRCDFLGDRIRNSNWIQTKTKITNITLCIFCGGLQIGNSFFEYFPNSNCLYLKFRQVPI